MSIRGTRRKFLSAMGSGIIMDSLSRHHNKFARKMPHAPVSEQLASSGRSQWLHSQERENSQLWDQDRWAPEVVIIKPTEVTHVIGYNGHLRGDLRLSSGTPAAVEPRSMPFGFLNSTDVIWWKVAAPKDSEYKVAVLYHYGHRDNNGSVMEVSAGGKRLFGLVQNPTKVEWKGGPPGRPAFRRDWLQGAITLRAGINIIELRLSKVAALQADLTQEDLSHPLGTWPKRSLHVLSIELARPKALQTLCNRAAELRAPADWLVDGKYGLFISWVPECYPLNGDVQSFQHYQESVSRFDVDTFSEVVYQTGASWIIFTTTHGKYYFPGPLKEMDKVLPGRTCKRDLVADLAEALAGRGIRLMLYFHPGPSAHEDKPWANAAGISPVDDDRYNSIILDIFAEVSERYRKSLSGWFIDGGYAYYVRNTPFERLTEVLKRGNLERLVAYYTWVFPEGFPFAGDFLSVLSQC
jgi:Alpha-L-fucosidase